MPRLVIGCGNAHAHHNHALDVTMDINGTLNPTIVGSITDPVSGLINNPAYRRFFTIIYFENIREDVFNTYDKCKIVVAHLAIVLAANGVVRIRSGADANAHLPNLRKAFRDFGFLIEHRLIFNEELNQFVPANRLDKYGVDMGALLEDEQLADFVVRRGAGTLGKSLESPI